jgi:hypothetical protein
MPSWPAYGACLIKPLIALCSKTVTAQTLNVLDELFDGETKFRPIELVVTVYLRLSGEERLRGYGEAWQGV